jgi:hypothetical protein
MGSEADQAVPVEAAERLPRLGAESHLVHDPGGIGEVVAPKGVVRLEPVQTEVQRVGAGGREEVVRVHAHPTGQTTTALP